MIKSYENLVFILKLCYLTMCLASLILLTYRLCLYKN
uniref:Uncharacterized protein n=1 Tax=Chondria sp. (in: red algae) TaxID=1982705 RepID=A0A1Z1MDV5_9FLOR|nr:hypothetical protein [Chondria sp. (in: red algae)]